PKWLRLVEVAGEADLIAGLDAGFVDPGVRGVGQHLAADEGLDAAILKDRHLLGIAEFRVRLVLDNAVLTVDGGLEQTPEWIGLYLACLMHLLDDTARPFVP